VNTIKPNCVKKRKIAENFFTLALLSRQFSTPTYLSLDFGFTILDFGLTLPSSVEARKFWIWDRR